MGVIVMMKLRIFYLLFLLATDSYSDRNLLTCDICLDVVTDIDNFITSDTTEQQIVEYVEEICTTLGALLPPDLHLDIFCINLVEEQLLESLRDWWKTTS